MLQIGAVEGHYFLKTGKLVSLSEQNIIDCNTEAGTCRGGRPERVFKYLETHAINSEETYPYEKMVSIF